MAMNKLIDLNPNENWAEVWIMAGFQHIPLTKQLPNCALGKTPLPLILPRTLPYHITSIVSFLSFFILFVVFLIF